MLIDSVCQNTQKSKPSFKGYFKDAKAIEEIGGKVALDSFEKADHVLQKLGEFYNIMVLKNRFEPDLLEIRVLSKPLIPGSRCAFDDICGSIKLDNKTKFTLDRILKATKSAIFNFIDTAKDKEKLGVDQILKENII